MKQYNTGRGFVCCGEPINIYDWAVTFYGFNEKCRRLKLVGGDGTEESERIKSFLSFRTAGILKTRLTSAVIRFLQAYFGSITVRVILLQPWSSSSQQTSNLWTALRQHWAQTARAGAAITGQAHWSFVFLGSFAWQNGPEMKHREPGYSDLSRQHTGLNWPNLELRVEGFQIWERVIIHHRHTDAKSDGRCGEKVVSQ